MTNRAEPTDTTKINFGLRSDDYARHRPGYPDSFFDRIETFVKLDGLSAVDLGTGPGIVAIELALRGSSVIGVDISEGQIAAADRRAEQAGVAERCTFIVSPAETTTLDSVSFDLVIASQCWGWFDEQKALQEVMRLLKPAGWFMIPQYCYLPQLDEVARESETLILRHNPTWDMSGFDGLYPWRVDAIIGGGFEFIEQFCYDHMHPFTHEMWRGRMRTCNGVGSGGMSADDVDRFDADLATLLAERFGDEPMMIRHRVWCVVARKPASAGS